MAANAKKRLSALESILDGEWEAKLVQAACDCSKASAYRFMRNIEKKNKSALFNHTAAIIKEAAA